MSQGAVLKRKRIAEAASWNVRLDSGAMIHSERARLHEWLADPGNAREYEAQRRLLAWAQDLPAGAKAELGSLLSPVTPLYRLTRRRPMQPRWLAALAAGLLCVTVGGAFLLRGPLERWRHTYRSGVGEVRTVNLPDGSTTSLNTRTHLAWVGEGDKDRRVQLLEGEAFFEVKSNPTHPFSIELNHSRITVLGTRFDVYEKQGDDVTVTVLAGTVKVTGFAPSGEWNVKLNAGQQLEYTPTDHGEKRNVDVSTTTDWLEGILRPDGEPVPSVVEQLQRYTTRQIKIQDSRLAKLKVMATLDIHDVSRALNTLAASTAAADVPVPIVVTTEGDAFILRRREDPVPAAVGEEP